MVTFEFWGCITTVRCEGRLELVTQNGCLLGAATVELTITFQGWHSDAVLALGFDITPEEGGVLTFDAFFEDGIHAVPMGTMQGVPCVALEGTESLPVFGFVRALG